MGNPLSDGTRTYTWQHGRQMATVTQNGETWVNTYNADGLRTKRTNGDLTYEYVYNGSQLTQLTAYGETVRFIYDESGVPMILQHNGQNYYYVTNPQGDVLAIVNSNGYPVATYLYDPWGKLIGSTQGDDGFIYAINPLLYRGYIYDQDTGLYYVNSRYYDPEIGRWINADGQIAGVGGDLIGYNMFAYCFNNPVNMSDPSGNWPKWAKKLTIAAAVVAAVAVVAVVTVATAGTGTVAAAVAIGAAKGAAIGFAMGAATGAVSGYVSTGTLDGTLNGMGDGALTGAITGAIVGGISGAATYNPGRLPYNNGGATYNSSTASTGKGFDTYSQLKKEIGSPGQGNEWHHIVEQSQIAKSGFSSQMIQNTDNIIAVSKATHRAISGYYSSIQPFTDGMIVRNWLAGQSFGAQYEFGINVIKMFM